VIASRLDTPRQTVSKWLKRLALARLPGLGAILTCHYLRSLAPVEETWRTAWKSSDLEARRADEMAAWSEAEPQEPIQERMSAEGASGYAQNTSP
jgi:hypothetical protein